MPGEDSDRFFIETEGWDEDALKLGLAWLARYAAENGYSEAAIAVGVKDQIRRMEPVLPKALSDPLQKHGKVRADGLTLKVILDRRMPFEFMRGQSSPSGRRTARSTGSMIFGHRRSA
jgi:hypothetical protein